MQGSGVASAMPGDAMGSFGGMGDFGFGSAAGGGDVDMDRAIRASMEEM